MKIVVGIKVFMKTELPIKNTLSENKKSGAKVGEKLSRGKI